MTLPPELDTLAGERYRIERELGRSERFDRELADVFAIQDEITQHHGRAR
jgi:hypothetical protein